MGEVGGDLSVQLARFLFRLRFQLSHYLTTATFHYSRIFQTPPRLLSFLITCLG